jgi:hypothetical protein
VGEMLWKDEEFVAKFELTERKRRKVAATTVTTMATKFQMSKLDVALKER